MQKFTTALLGAMSASPASGMGRPPSEVSTTLGIPDPGRVAELMGLLLRCFDGGVHGRLAPEIQLKAAECLGILGAWDPARTAINLSTPIMAVRGLRQPRTHARPQIAQSCPSTDSR